LVEFSYNNEYHESLKMIPFKVLYGRNCRKPTNWNNQEYQLILGPDMLEEMEHTVRKVRHNLKVSRTGRKNLQTEKGKTTNFKWEITFMCK